MTIVYTRRELAQRIAKSGDEQDIKLASGRVQHWTERGLFQLFGVKHVGRGRARVYPEDSLWLAAFLDHCADRGATIEQMSLWGAGLMGPRVVRQVLGVAFPEMEAAFQAAISGKRGIYLVVRDPPSGDERPAAAVARVGIGVVPEIPAHWSGAVIFHLSLIFDRVRQ